VAGQNMYIYVSNYLTIYYIYTHMYIYLYIYLFGTAQGGRAELEFVGLEIRRGGSRGLVEQHLKVFFMHSYAIKRRVECSIVWSRGGFNVSCGGEVGLMYRVVERWVLCIMWWREGVCRKTG
jgi:hypothetical protein